jgi:hypothetical protein
MFMAVVSVEVMFDVTFNNYGSPSMSSSIGVLGIIYGIMWYADVTFRGKMGLRDQHYVYIAEGQVGF